MFNFRIRLIKSVLLLLGSVFFAYSAALALHEFGHAFGFWLTGTDVYRIVINPLGNSYTQPSTFSPSPTFTTWAGPLFGTTWGVLLFAAFWRWRGPYTILPLMTGIVCCIFNGLYLLVALANITRGDANVLVSQGVPWTLIACVGVAFTLLGVALALLIGGALGIRREDGFRVRVAVVIFGVLPYALIEIIYYIVTRQRCETLECFLYWIPVGVFIPVFAACSRWLESRFKWLHRDKTNKITWKAVGLANGLAAALLMLLVSVSFIQNKPTTTVRYMLHHYDGDSNYIGNRLKMVHVPNAKPGERYDTESLIFWSFDGKQGRYVLDYSCWNLLFDEKMREILVPVFWGLIGIRIDEPEHRWIFKNKHVSLRSYLIAVNQDYSRLLLPGIYWTNPDGVGDSNKILISIDTATGKSKQFDNCYPSSILFKDNYEALLTEANNLLRIKFVEDSEPEFEIIRNISSYQEVKGVCKGKEVYHISPFDSQDGDANDIIMWGELQFSFGPQEVRIVRTSDSFVWITLRNGTVVRLDESGEQKPICQVDVKDYIGSGAFSDTFWIAFRDGFVRTFGEIEREDHIELSMPEDEALAGAILIDY